jgi:hypothetical protein
MENRLLWWAVPCTLLILFGAAVSQTGHSTRSLSINGHVGEVIVYQIDGKSYVDLESLVHIANGSMSSNGNQITLTFPPPGSAPIEPSSAADNTLSAQFMTSSVQTLAVIKEWTNALSYAAQRGVPGDGSRVIVFHDRAVQALHLAQVAASSDSDRDALQLLTNHFQTVSAWSDKLIGERKRMDTGKYSVSEDALKKDETYQKIAACSKFLSSMLPNGVFHNDSSCR